jgi:hydroxyethylthiazole kinase
MNYSETISRDLAAVREKRPLVHNITNFVVMNLTANALLALGASPIMAHAIEELEDLIRIASALVLNIGTLDAAWIASMEKAAVDASKRGIPIVLDPVGAGASRFRTATALALIHEGRPAIVRGNASEIMALDGAEGATKGVDSTQGSDAAEDAARSLARSAQCVVVVSGAVDFLTDGTAAVRLSGGSPLAPLVSGMGCTASALLGAFAAVAPSPFDAAAAGMGVMKTAAELAAAKASGPGAFQVHFLDALHSLCPADLSSRLKIGEAPAL